MCAQFKNMDANNDGKLELHEIEAFLMKQAMETALPMITEQLKAVKAQIAEELKKAFEKADADKDGFVDRAEFDVVLQEAKDAGESAEEMELMDFDAMDENKDGKVSEEEFMKYMGKAMKKKFREELVKQFA